MRLRLVLRSTVLLCLAVAFSCQCVQADEDEYFEKVMIQRLSPSGFCCLLSAQLIFSRGPPTDRDRPPSVVCTCTANGCSDEQVCLLLHPITLCRTAFASGRFWQPTPVAVSVTKRSHKEGLSDSSSNRGRELT